MQFNGERHVTKFKVKTDEETLKEMLKRLKRLRRTLIYPIRTIGKLPDDKTPPTRGFNLLKCKFI